METSSTHRPLHPDRRGREDGGVVEVDDHVSQLLLDLAVVHTLTGWGDVCKAGIKNTRSAMQRGFAT